MPLGRSRAISFVKGMAKLRIADNRLRVGNWSIPLRPHSWMTAHSDAHTKLNGNGNGEAMAGRPRSISAMAVTAPVGVEEVAKVKDVERSSGLSASAEDKRQPIIVEASSQNTSQTTATSDLVELASIITRETERLDAYMKKTGLPNLGFDKDSLLKFPHLPDEIKKAREQIVQATQDLGDLVKGPEEKMRWLAWDVSSSDVSYSEIGNRELTKLA